MTPARPALRERAAWRALEAHHAETGERHLRACFAADPGRAERFTREAVGIRYDFSKQRIDATTLDEAPQISL